MASHPRWQQVGGNAAEVYERHLVPAMFAPWAPKLIEKQDLDPDLARLDDPELVWPAPILWAVWARRP